MNRILQWVGILALFAVSAKGATKPSLFPVQEGNYWILKSSLGDEKIIRCEPGTNKLVRVTGLSDRDVTFYASLSSPKLFRWDPAKGRAKPTVSLRQYKKGQYYFRAGNRPCDQLLILLNPTVGFIRTSAGDYAGCSVLLVTPAYPILPGVCDLLAEKTYFAPGVGPVAIQGALDRLYLLVEARVDGVMIGGK